MEVWVILVPIGWCPGWVPFLLTPNYTAGSYDGPGNMQEIRTFVGNTSYWTNCIVGTGVDKHLNAMYKYSSSM